MELLFKKNIIGYIDNIFKEDNWIHGVFIQNDNFKNFLPYLVLICNKLYHINLAFCFLLLSAVQ